MLRVRRAWFGNESCARAIGRACPRPVLFVLLAVPVLLLSLRPPLTGLRRESGAMEALEAVASRVTLLATREAARALEAKEVVWTLASELPLWPHLPLLHQLHYL